MPHRVALSGLLVAGCHVTVRSHLARPVATERIRHLDAAVARPATLTLTDAGQLRFVEPLACPTEQRVTEQRGIEIATRPNLAAFVVGVIASGVGSVLTVRGLTDRDPGASPFLYGGLGALVGGLPLAIGPWFGNDLELRGAPDATVLQPGPSEPCGDRPLVARSAVLTVHGIDVHGQIDRDGVLSISPYQLFDAYDQPATAIDVTAVVDTAGGPRTVTAVLDGSALASRAAMFLARADFEARIEPLRLVPGVTAGAPHVSLSSTAAGTAVRIVLALENAGPGPAWAVRGHVTAPGARAIDGRVMYFGHLAKGAVVSRELVIPVTEAIAAALRAAPIDLAIELRDAHGTAPATPLRFRGRILVDGSR